MNVTELECGTVICRRLLAQRVSVNEAMISESAAVSRFFSANYVKTPSLTVAVSEIGEADADEIVHLTPKPRGMLLTLLLSMLRGILAAPDGKPVTGQIRKSAHGSAGGRTD